MRKRPLKRIKISEFNQTMIPKVKHASNAYKYLPAYPEYDDILYVLQISNKKVYTFPELLKLFDCEESKLMDRLNLCVESGNLKLIDKDKYEVLHTNIAEIEHTEE